MSVLSEVEVKEEENLNTNAEYKFSTTPISAVLQGVVRCLWSVCAVCDRGRQREGTRER